MAIWSRITPPETVTFPRPRLEYIELAEASTISSPDFLQQTSFVP